MMTLSTPSVFSLMFKRLCRVLLVVAMCIAPAAYALQATPPDKTINNLFVEMNGRLKSEKEVIAKNRNRLVEIGEEVLGPYVSFQKMAMQILGKHWRTVSSDQKIRYVAAFKNRVSYAIASRYDPKEEYDLSLKDARYSRDKRKALVKSVVTNKGNGKRYLIDYKVFFDQKNNRWAVYDVVVEGVSVLQSFKSASNETVARDGIEALIKELEGEASKDQKKVDTQSGA